ncbi:hypothetical protein UFOVP80_28 [uncultured Caudovirales phage]|jgi:hypothetical protein|uniref:Uncharacterized protein n=1 Tax=uncultured Caudovirales phage TaxID=2100421 RepID=A0A6J5KVU3_9CAUD|nr:hypothetical protein UFOVP80_28 [uncultured Caudovirales phage]
MKAKPDYRKNRPPYDNRSTSNAGKYHGIGIPAQVGAKKGTYTDMPREQKESKTSLPPRKMN